MIAHRDDRIAGSELSRADAVEALHQVVVGVLGFVAGGRTQKRK